MKSLHTAFLIALPVLLTHTAALGGPDENAVVPAVLDRWGTRLDSHAARGAVVLLYDLRNAD